MTVWWILVITTASSIEVDPNLFIFFLLKFLGNSGKIRTVRWNCHIMGYIANEWDRSFLVWHSDTSVLHLKKMKCNIILHHTLTYKNTSSENCIHNAQQNSLPHVSPFSINTVVSYNPLVSAFKLPKALSSNPCIPFFFFSSFHLLPPHPTPGSYCLFIPE